jgi:hypothetical protein
LNIDPSHSLSENNVNLKIIFKMLFNSINTDYNISVLSNISTEYPQLNEKNAIIFDKLIIKNWATNFQQLVEGLRMGNMEKLEGFMRLVPFAEFTVVLNRYKDYFDPKNKDERDIIADINKRIKLLNNYSSELKKANLTLGREEKFDKSAALVNFKKFKELRDAQGNDFLSSLAVALNDASEKIELKVDRALRNHQVKMREIRKFFPEFSFTILLELTNSQLRAHLKDEMLLFRGSSGIRYKYPNDQDKAAVGTPDSPFFASKKPFAALKREAVLRGIEPRAPDEWQDYSISLGNSLFAGAYADIGACAWSYILDAPYGYSLSIKKYDNNILAYIFIAPTHPLVAFFGKGEFFHSRTKIARNAMNAVGLSPLGGGTPELILVESDENASEIGFALRSYYLKHMKIVTYKEGQDEPQLFNYKSKLAPKLIKNFEAQLTREFDVLFFREHVAKYKAVIDRINNQKLSPNQPDLNSP